MIQTSVPPTHQPGTDYERLIDAMIAAYEKEARRPRRNHAPGGQRYETWVQRDIFRAVLAAVRNWQER
jgi:hypothetical protein